MIIATYNQAAGVGETVQQAYTELTGEVGELDFTDVEFYILGEKLTVELQPVTILVPTRKPK